MIRRMAIGSGVLLSMALLTAPSDAAVSWNLKPSGTGNWDWNLKGVYQIYDYWDPNTSLPFTLYYGFMWHDAADHCIEISTGPGRFVANPDTRIWVGDGSGSVWSVNDDFGGTLLSKARLWIQYTGATNEGPYNVWIKPYNSNYSFDDYELITTRRDLSEAACTTNQTTIPWVKIIGNGNLPSTLVFSPNAS
jgi:hypothetical protein